MGGDGHLLELTEGQKEIWFSQQTIDCSPRFNTAEIVNILGEIDHEKFSDAVVMTISKVKHLNAGFHLNNGVLVQEIAKQQKINHRFLDFSKDKSPHTTLQNWINNDLSQPVSLCVPLLYVSCLIKITDNNYKWYFRSHHILMDGFSTGLLIKSVSELYSKSNHLDNQINLGCCLELEAMIHAEKNYASSPHFITDRRFWSEYCSSINNVARLSSSQGGICDYIVREKIVLSPDIFSAIKSHGEEFGYAWPIIIIAIISSFINWKNNSNKNVCIGIPFMNRNTLESLRTPGMTVNILPLKLQFNGLLTLREIAIVVNEELKKIKTHSRYRGMSLLRFKNNGEPLFGPVLNIMPFYENFMFDNIPAEIDNIYGGPVDDLALRIVPDSSNNNASLNIFIDGNPNVYSHVGMKKIAQELQQWLEELSTSQANDISAYYRKKDAELDFELISGPDEFFTFESVISRLERTIINNPESVAIISPDDEITYYELGLRISNARNNLSNYGIKYGDIVAIYMPRSIDTLVLMLAVISVGAICLIMDIKNPINRSNYILSNCNVKVLIFHIDSAAIVENLEVTNKCYYKDLLVSHSTRGEKFNVSDKDGCFIIFTSGTTGEPKGVLLSHQSIHWFICAAISTYEIVRSDRMLQFSSLCFDACIEEIFIPLFLGGTLVLRSEESGESLDAFLDYVELHKISVLDLPTTFWHTLTMALGHQERQLPASVRKIIIGGEAVSPERLTQWFTLVKSQAEIINTYGPTEGTVVFTCKKFDEKTTEKSISSKSIGRPLGGLGCLILDENQRPVLPGVEGELYLTGPTLAERYINSNTETAAHFRQITVNGVSVRAYKTGDWVSLADNREILYIGRKDKQIKLRGYRIDLNEIRDCALAVVGVKDARAVIKNKKILNLFISLADESVSPEIISNRLHAFLPAYAQPNNIIITESFPLTISGKINELELMEFEPQQHISGLSGKVSDFEKTVISIWEEILEITGITSVSSFNGLGGSSLNIFSIKEKLLCLGLDIPVKILIENDTVQDIYSDWKLWIESERKRFKGQECVVSLSRSIRKQCIWAIHPYSGRVDCYKNIAGQLTDYINFLAIQAPYVAGIVIKNNSLDELADFYISLIKQTQPEGPYGFIGYSLGGIIAFILSEKLLAHGDEIFYVGLIDSMPPTVDEKTINQFDAMVIKSLGKAYLAKIAHLDSDSQICKVAERLVVEGHVKFMNYEQLVPVLKYGMECSHYKPVTLRKYVSDINVHHYCFSANSVAWSPFIRGRSISYQYRGDHGNVINELEPAGAMKDIVSDIRKSIGEWD